MKTPLLISLLFLGFAPLFASAAPPELQTPTPVIYLADNLDEPDNLGWCIDTVGRGFSEQLHAHSCKPQGGDVQFAYNAETQQIMSVEFPGKCADLNQPAAAGSSLSLLDCSAAEEQKFLYSADSMEFMPVAGQTLCITAGGASQSAGPFMSRALELADCASAAPELKQWVIKN